LQPTVLIAVLNWGLGHATRTIPVINYFLKKNFEVHIASDGEALAFLRKEYPQLNFYDLPSYNISYPYSSIVLNILRSSLFIVKAIVNEKKATNRIVSELKPQYVVSDNRYGVRSKIVRSILITHQINIYHRISFISKFASFFIKLLINKFDQIWIPDFKDDNSLAGILSKAPTGIDCNYIGPLSRFSKKKKKVKYKIAVILSGPEPQRSKLEEIIKKQLINFKEKVILIRGKIEDGNDYYLGTNVLVKNYCLSEELNDIMNQSEIIISRSGYSTIMDLVKIGKKAILIPTPGQTEQEYLANYLKEKKYFYFQNQNNFNLLTALNEIENYHGVSIKIVEKDFIKI